MCRRITVQLYAKSILGWKKSQTSWALLLFTDTSVACRRDPSCCGGTLCQYIIHSFIHHDA